MISFFYIFFPLIGGIIVSLLTDFDKYQIINKPILSPPGYIFPIVWTILYLLLGYSSYITKDKKNLKIFYINLAINYIWSFIFFNLGNYFKAFILIIVMIILEVILLIRYYKNNKKAFIINLIYLVWLLFALYLNLGVFILN